MTESASDVREGGRWSPLQRFKNDLLWALVWTAVKGLGALSPRALHATGRTLGRLAYVVAPATRRLAEHNVALAFPELDPTARRALVAHTYQTLGGYLGDALSMLHPQRPVASIPFETGARETLDRAIGEGRGVLFASAHLGPWERVASTLSAAAIPFIAVAREAYDPRFQSLYDRLRFGRGLDVIYRGSPGAGARLVRGLRRGRVIGIPMDLASRVPSLDVPFLGIPARTPLGPARLALRTGAAVVVGVPTPSHPVTGSLELAIDRITTVDLHSSAEGERILTTRINDVLSKRIRAMPEAWVWMHPRWGGLPM